MKGQNERRGVLADEQAHISEWSAAMAAPSHGWIQEPLRHKKARQGTCEAVTTPSRENLELEYADSLIRVIRSRKDGEARVLTSARSAPTERSVPVAQSVVLLSGCDKFNLRRAETERLAPLSSSTHRSLPACDREGVSFSNRSSSENREKHAGKRAGSPQFAASFVVAPFPVDRPERRKPQASVLSALRSAPTGHEQRGSAKKAADRTAEPTWKWCPPEKLQPIQRTGTLQESIASPGGLETASGPGVATFKDGHVLSTVRFHPAQHDFL